MSDMIKREDVLAIIEERFSMTMIGDILKQDINALPEAEIRTAGRQCKIDRCELFNRLATITAEDANEMKAKIYAVIQEMPAIPERVIAEIKIDTDELMERIREEYELTDDIVPSADRPQGEWIFDPEILCSDIGVYSAGYRCSVCGKDYFKVDRMNYCPNCGARMKGADDEESV